MQFLPYILTGMIIGGIVEGVAYWQEWWIFNPPSYIFIQVTMWEGLVMGGLAFFFRSLPVGWLFAASAAFGGTAEFCNILLLHRWSFPDDRFLFFHGNLSILLVMTAAWALYLPLVVTVNKKISRGS